MNLKFNLVIVLWSLRFLFPVNNGISDFLILTKLSTEQDSYLVQELNL